MCVSLDWHQYYPPIQQVGVIDQQTDDDYEDLNLPARKSHRSHIIFLITRSQRSHIFPFASEIIEREGGGPVTDKGTIKNLPKPVKMRKNISRSK